MTQTYTVTAAWTYDRRYEAGDRVNLTREQYEYFSATMPGLLEPSDADVKTTKRKTPDGETDA